MTFDDQCCVSVVAGSPSADKVMGREGAGREAHYLWLGRS